MAINPWSIDTSTPEGMADLLRDFKEMVVKQGHTSTDYYGMAEKAEDFLLVVGPRPKFDMDRSEVGKWGDACLLASKLLSYVESGGRIVFAKEVV